MAKDELAKFKHHRTEVRKAQSVMHGHGQFFDTVV